MKADIHSSNSKFLLDCLLTNTAQQNINLHIRVSDSKKSAHLLFSPHTKNTPRSVKLTKSWHIIDIQHCMNVLNPYNLCEDNVYVKTSATASVIRSVNNLYYMFTGKPGKFTSVNNTIMHKGSPVELTVCGAKIYQVSADNIRMQLHSTTDHYWEL